MMQETNSKFNFENSVCLTMAINLFVFAQQQFLLKGLSLELIRPGELKEYFMYLGYVFEIGVQNRHNLLQVLAGDKKAAF
mmetsp:Transcript_7510/g.12686  ORF Transcript_7510/g.12686 Transcript_7510/m.12686 type:complete len:80 (+) Transcript_7510:108-347(+)